MSRRNPLPPATDFTLGDKLRLAFGVLILFFGVAILWRTLPIAFSWQAILVGALFIAFGVYRLWLGYTRWKEWRGNR